MINNVVETCSLTVYGAGYSAHYLYKVVASCACSSLVITLLAEG